MVESRYPLLEALEKAAAFGAQNYEIDIGIGRPGEAWEARLESWRRMAPRARATAEQVGLKLPSLCLGVLWQYSLASPLEAERAMGVRVVREGCELAQALGATALLLPVGQPPGLEPERGRENVIASLRSCLAAAEAAGVRLGLENVCQAVLLTADDLLEVVQAVASPACGIYYDLGNPSFVGLDPAAELPRLAKHLVRVHAKDTVAVPRERPPLPETPITGDFTVWGRRTTVDLGTGEVDFSGLSRTLAEVGYREGVILEVPQPAERVEGGCRENLAAARHFFGS